MAGKVTVDLASHWTCVTDISGSPPKPWRGRWAPAYALLVEYDKLNLYLYSRIAQVPGWSPGEDPLGIAGVSFLQAKYGMSFLSPNQQCQSIEVLSYLSISHSTYISFICTTNCQFIFQSSLDMFCFCTAYLTLYTLHLSTLHLLAQINTLHQISNFTNLNCIMCLRLQT